MRILQRVLLFLFCAAVIVLAFVINLDAQLAEFESTAKSREASVNEYVEIMGSFIDTMTIYGNGYLKRSLPDPTLYKYIQYDSKLNSFHMDAIKGTQYENDAGNLTGTGVIPTSGPAKTEINLALDYSKYFSSFYKRIPEIAWLYYTSESHFIYMYPWVSSSDFAYSDDLKQKEFYSFVSPQSNPSRRPTWTPVYMDAAGKGLMVTLSSPIYFNDNFAGVLSLDLTTNQLGKIISSDYKSYLIDIRNSVIAASPNVEFDRKEIQFDELSGLSQKDIDQLRNEGGSKVQNIGNHYVYTTEILNTPWRFYSIVPTWSVIGLSILYTSPILAISVLLVWTLFEAEKRRRAEVMLSNSLAEIKSYHKLLENSAKHDFLTNTCNRRGLAESFETLISSSEAKVPISFVIGDIDEFKRFNDTYGHTAGDRVLVEIANIMKNAVGSKDVVCRWGGEEFVIMLHGKSYKDALSIAEKIRKEIESNTIPWVDSKELHATMTFGVAEYDEKYTMQNAVSKADNALYIGKKKGRNCVIGWQEEDQQPCAASVCPENA